MKGITALRRRYSVSEDGFMALVQRLYRAALKPLNATVREIARGRWAGKFRMQRTKHTVLNQHMLHPANKHRTNTCIHSF